jgi:hypothetical protein
MLYFTGDIHGGIDIRKLSTAGLTAQSVAPTEDDFLVICGDFGLVWNKRQNSEERYWLRWLAKKPWTTLFVDGNHENFDRLNALPVEEWHGGLVHPVHEKVLHLMRGQAYDVCGMSLFAMGGARSTDKAWRKEGISWWPQEMPSDEDFDRAEAALDAHGRTVDVVVTHCAPTMVQYRLNRAFEPDRMTDWLEHLRDTVSFKRWYFGHYHLDRDFADGFSALYERIVPLGLK